MWWNERFTSWMCSRQICSNCVMLSCQYEPKSLRNVSNTLLNLCHEELRQFWRQKGVQPGTSKVYLIKWSVSVYQNCVFYLVIRIAKNFIWWFSQYLDFFLHLQIPDFQIVVSRPNIVQSYQTIHQCKAYLFSFQMMYKYTFRKIDHYDWFCGTGSHILKLQIQNNKYKSQLFDLGNNMFVSL